MTQPRKEAIELMAGAAVHQVAKRQAKEQRTDAQMRAKVRTGRCVPR